MEFRSSYVRIVWVLFLLLSSAKGAEDSIEVGDYLGISFSGISALESERLTSNYAVDDEGEICFPEIGKVMAAGLSFKELAKKLTKDFESLSGDSPEIQVGAKVSGCNFRFSIEARGDIKNRGFIETGRFSSLQKMCESAEVKMDSWGPLEVRVLREGCWYRLFPYSSERLGNERMFAKDVVVFSKKSCWEWFSPTENGKVCHLNKSDN